VSNPYVVNTREINWYSEVVKAYGPDWNQPDTAYRFSNGREFDESDGVYARSLLDDVWEYVGSNDRFLARHNQQWGFPFLAVLNDTGAAASDPCVLTLSFPGGNIVVTAPGLTITNNNSSFVTVSGTYAQILAFTADDGTGGRFFKLDYNGNADFVSDLTYIVNGFTGVTTFYALSDARSLYDGEYTISEEYEVDFGSASSVLDDVALTLNLPGDGWKMQLTIETEALIAASGFEVDGDEEEFIITGTQSEIVALLAGGITANASSGGSISLSIAVLPLLWPDELFLQIGDQQDATLTEGS
jgi:hypothetical protein